MRYGLQMYGLNPLFLHDQEGFLRRLSAAGYRYLEPCISLKEIPGLEDRIWTPEQLNEYMPLIQKYGFSLASAHIFTPNFLQELPELVKIAKKYDISQLVLPCPREINPAVAVDLTRAGDALQKCGLQLLLHNDRDDLGYGWLLMACGDSVGAQVDVGWLLYNGVDPEVFLWRNKQKVRSLHYKDFDQGKQETAVGTGMVDMAACFQFARAQEIIQILDQDGSRGDFLTDMENAAAKLRYLAQNRDHTVSQLCILDTETGDVTQLKEFDRIIEAPNWMQTNEDTLIFNSDGRLYRYSISSGTETLLNTGRCTNCNNDHVLSFDNREIAVSHSENGWISQIYILPITGGEPRLITPNAPSYLHGWSPDGKELCYCAFRDNGDGMEVDVFAIGAEGGEEWQLTRQAGFNDGPEYSPDGNYIWFNSTRTGLMQCWRMHRDGTEPTQMTFSQRNNWFPHVSPDGKQVVYLSYSCDGLDASEHLPNMHVQLRLMDADGSNDRLLLQFFGGQGSINVNSWNADSKRLAFVRYVLSHK